MSKFEKSRELRVSLHCSPFALANASQKSLERISVDVLALRAGNEEGEYVVGAVCHRDKVRASGNGSTEKG